MIPHEAPRIKTVASNGEWFLCRIAERIVENMQQIMEFSIHFVRFPFLHCVLKKVIDH